MEDLEKSFENAVEQPLDIYEEKFIIDNMQKAEWATKKIAQRQARIAQIKAFAKAKIERINKWVESECEPLENDIRHFSFMMRPYIESEIAKLKKGKTVKFSNGAKVSMKTPPIDFQYDDAELLAFLQSHKMDEFVKTETKIKPMWKEFKAACVVDEFTTTDESGNESTQYKMVTQDGEVVEIVKLIMPERDDMNVDVKAVEI
ncbi:MAG: host-nuclease inhibitor Gam family protein [Clostridia bacterium]|nr:host-nuclease inhibitor Gam family protein [Clostridia bacterium]